MWCRCGVFPNTHSRHSCSPASHSPQNRRHRLASLHCDSSYTGWLAELASDHAQHKSPHLQCCASCVGSTTPGMEVKSSSVRVGFCRSSGKWRCQLQETTPQCAILRFRRRPAAPRAGSTERWGGRSSARRYRWKKTCKQRRQMPQTEEIQIASSGQASPVCSVQVFLDTPKNRQKPPN